MSRVEESIQTHLVDEAEAARAWFSRNGEAEFKLTGIVDPEEVQEPSRDTQTRELQLILCGYRDGQDVCGSPRAALSASPRTGGSAEVYRSRMVFFGCDNTTPRRPHPRLGEVIPPAE